MWFYLKILIDGMRKNIRVAATACSLQTDQASRLYLNIIRNIETEREREREFKENKKQCCRFGHSRYKLGDIILII